MKKIQILLLSSLLSFNFYSQETTKTVFDQIMFYDGYAATVAFPTPNGVIRHRNDLYAVKLSSTDILSMGSTLDMNVTIKAVCDNYDRIGNVNLAFVPKGDTIYNTNEVQKIEIARFITPFMNKNIQPDEVPYDFQINNVLRILKDEVTSQMYDFWIELQVFGVPYAANTEVAGCAGRNDVFMGSLTLTSNLESIVSNDYIIPLNFQNNLNDYQVGASDAIGESARTIDVNVPTNITNSKLYLITSNHGANSGGEEYNRRFHYIYFDSALVLTYKPGETSCEPYRIYNTQGNGIYSPSPRTDAEWQSFSNWCPGAVIPTREIDLGNLTAGQHTFKLDIPTAVFANNEGNFPISLYLQGTRDNLGIDEFKLKKHSISPNPSTSKIKISGIISYNDEVKIVDVLGNSMPVFSTFLSPNEMEINLENFEQGSYFIKIKSNQGQECYKIIKIN